MKTTARLVLCMLLATTPVFAHNKTDVIVMNNGDRFTCEIKSLDAGVLYVGFDYIQGTIPVDWSKVRQVESTQLFLVKTEGGSIYTGTLSTPERAEGRPVQIQVVEGAKNNVLLERPQIVRIDQTSEHFWRRFNGEIDSGLIYAKGNQSTQYNFGAQLRYPRERWAAGGAYASALSGSTGATASTRNDGSFFVRRTLQWDNWFYAGLGNFLQSSEQSIALQSNIGAGVGHFLKNTNHASIALIGGLAYQNTRYSQSPGAPGSQNSVAVLAGTNLELFKFNKTNLTINANAFPSISQAGRIFSNVDATYYVKVFSNLTWNFSFYGNWDNEPPAHFNGSNYGLSSGFGWTFGNR